MIDGSGINLIAPGGEFEEVYSVAFLGRDSNVWAQKYGTMDLRSELSDLYEDPQELVVTEPINIVYDERTANVVVAMGIQGVLVGDSDETWRRVAVGDFAPTDFSFPAKARLMLSLHFWLGALTFSLAFVAAAVALSQNGVSLSAIQVAGPRVTYRRMMGVLLLLIPLAFIAMVLSEGALIQLPFSLEVLGFLVISLPLVLAAFAWAWPGRSNVRRVIAFIFAVLGGVLSMRSLPPFGGDVGSLYLDVDIFFTIGGLVLASIALAIYPPQRRQLTAFAIALLTMNTAIFLPFVLWLTGGLTLLVASLASLALLILTAYALRRHLNRQGPSLGA